MPRQLIGSAVVRLLIVGLLATGFSATLSTGLAAEKAPIKLEQTFYYSGDIHGTPWSSSAIAVDADGTVAVAINRSVGPGSFPASNDDKALVLLYDKTGQPIGRVASRTSSMIDVCFGADGRLYTAEGWFAAGTHIHDRPGAKDRYVPVRHFKSDGSHVDKVSPSGVAVGRDYRMYTILQGRLHILSPEDKQIQVIDRPGNGYGKVDVAADGTVYSGDRVLLADGTWKQLKYTVRSIAPSGRLLVTVGGQWGILDPKHADAAKQLADLLEIKVKLPPGEWGDQALGADGNIYLAPKFDPGLAYVVAAPDGKVLLRRGADFDRLTVVLSQLRLTAGAPATFTAAIIRSRDAGYVPASEQLPEDNRPALKLRAFLAPLSTDPLAQRTWRECALTALPADGGGTEAKTYTLAVPTDCFGSYDLRLAAAPPIPGATPLEVQTAVTIQPQNARAFLSVKTDRDRTGFAAGQPIRLTVAVDASADVDLTGAALDVSRDGKTVWSASLGLTTVSAGRNPIAVVILPAELTARLRPGEYQATCAKLPEKTAGQAVTVAIADPVRLSAFETVFHPIGPGELKAADARVHAEMGATHVATNAAVNFRTLQTYADMAVRLGMTYSMQPHTHFAALNSLPQEQGAVCQWFALVSQRMQTYPGFRGFNYHDLWAPFGTWWDQPRKSLYPPLWDERGKQMILPESVPAQRRQAAQIAYGSSYSVPYLYRQWGPAIHHADPRLERTTMQWWHTSLAMADPDKVAADQDVISTQHMEEQYYHPVTTANQVDLWRRPGKPLYCYGNATFQDDGSGAETYREMMAGWSRGVQGLGRDYLPTAGSATSERTHRVITPIFRMLSIFGGISAACEPVDQVAVWRSLFQEACEPENRPSPRRHLFNTTAAYTACLYAHRTAGIITDQRVRDGDLKKYQAVIISFGQSPPADLVQALKTFQDAGGLVLANKPADGYWAPTGAVQLGGLFGPSFASPEHNDDVDRFWQLQQNEGGEQARKIREALGDKVHPLADCDDPAVWVNVLSHGQATYIFLVNLKLLPMRPADLHRYGAFQNTVMPTRTELRIMSGAYRLYDILAGREVRPAETKPGTWTVTADMSVFPGAVFAMVPDTSAFIGKLAPAGQTAAGQTADCTGLVLRADLASDVASPLEIQVLAPDLSSRYHFFRTTRHGAWKETLPIAANDSPGKWTVSVRDLLSNRRWNGPVDIATPNLPAARPVPAIEWTRASDVTSALSGARSIAVVVEGKQKDAIAPAVGIVKELLAGLGKQVTEITSADYLADRRQFGWDKFEMGGKFAPELQLRPKKFDVIIAFDLPALPGKIIPLDALPIPLTATDPGPGRGLVQFIAMPVYDTEDAISLAAGNVAGLVGAANALSGPPPAMTRTPEVTAVDLHQLSLVDNAGTLPSPNISKLIGVPVSEVVASADGTRLAVAMKGWGYNFMVLDGNGKPTDKTAAGNILGQDVCGKYFPIRLRAMDSGFSALEHESDAAVLYTKLYDRSGQPIRRLAAPGRRISGTADVSVSHPQVTASVLCQASFSVTPDGRFAAVGGSKAIAVWDLASGTVLWRDDTVCHDGTAGRDPAAYPQVAIAPDGQSIVVQHQGKMVLRDGRTGKTIGEVRLPLGSSMGAVQVFDGHTLVVGDSEFFGYRDGKLQWWWKAPADLVTAFAFAPDGLHYAIGQPNGTLRIMKGGGQIGGLAAPSGGILSVAISADGARIAWATTTGWCGVVDAAGHDLWRWQVYYGDGVVTNANPGPRAVINFAGQAGDTVVGDWLGRVRRFDTGGTQLWETNLTPQVYRDDLATLLAIPDPTPTLRLPPPRRQASIPPQGRENVARQATITLTPPRTSGWKHPIEPLRGGGTSLNDGKVDQLETPWFSESAVSYLVGSDYTRPLTWELAWKQPVRIDTVVVHECTQHPEAVPEEIAIEAWIDEGDWHGWKRLIHDRWNSGTVHTHHFPAVTTGKLRYVVYGDFGRNLRTTEIEAY